MVNTYDVTVTYKGEDTKVSLRLTLAAQIELKKKYGANAATTIFSAMDDPEVMSDVLTQALTWKGNENAIKFGTVLYDALVDSGYAGEADFGELITSVAVASGILSAAQKDKIMAQVTNAYDKMFEDEGAEKNAVKP